MPLDPEYLKKNRQDIVSVFTGQGDPEEDAKQAAEDRYQKLFKEKMKRRKALRDQGLPEDTE